MADERYFEVVITKSIFGVIRVDADDRASDNETFEDVARRFVSWDEGWVRGSREEQTDSTEIIDITEMHKALLSKAGGE